MFITGYIQQIDYIGGEYSETIYIDGEPLAEILESFRGKNVYVCYAFSQDRITIEKMIDLSIMSAMGECDARLYGRYSEITGFLWLEQAGMVGNHNLLYIFEQHPKEFGAIVIQETPIDLTMLSEG